MECNSNDFLLMITRNYSDWEITDEDWENGETYLVTEDELQLITTILRDFSADLRKIVIPINTIKQI